MNDSGQAPRDASAAVRFKESSATRPIFICYRQVDGKRYARWIYAALTNLLAARQDESPVYFDQTSPATIDWTSIHGPALERACALVVICTPGLLADHGKHD